MENSFSSTSRAGRLHAAQTLLVAAMAIAVYAWILVQLFGNSRGFRDADPARTAIKAGAVANVLSLILLLDAVHRVLSHRRSSSARGLDRLFIVSGVSARVRAAIALLTVLGRASLWSVVPVLGLQAVMGARSNARTLALLGVSAGFILVGDALGRCMDRLANGGRMLGWLLIAAWYGCMVAALSYGFLGPAVPVGSTLRAIGSWPWPAMTVGEYWAPVAGVIVASSIAVAFATQWRWASRHGEVRVRSVRERLPADAAHSTQIAARGRTTPIRRIAKRELSRLAAWVSREPLAFALLLVFSGVPVATLPASPGGLPAGFRDPVEKWTAMYCMSLWSLALVELVWSQEGRGEWASFRVRLGHLRVPATGRVAVLFAMTAVVALVLTIPLLLHSAARFKAPVFLLDLLLSGAGGVAVGSAAAATALRADFAFDAISRVFRYSGVGIGLSVSPAVLELSGFRSLSLLAILLLTAVAITVVVNQVGKMEFVRTAERVPG